LDLGYPPINLRESRPHLTPNPPFLKMVPSNTHYTLFCSNKEHFSGFEVKFYMDDYANFNLCYLFLIKN